jgi:predicted cation transporter
VVACFAAGLGAILTPLGEPMSTIMVQRLSGPPYNAGFVFPIKHFAVLVVPGVAAFAVFGAVWAGSSTKKPQAENPAASAEAPAYSETAWSVVLRAVKVYAFVAALVLLGEGFKPVITWFFMGISPLALYWINIVSAILDNATLTAIEINGSMSLPQIIAICMGLLISGGMLIPGNIPNIVSAGRLKITMKEWAVIGIPIGLVVLAIYFVILLFYIF